MYEDTDFCRMYVPRLKRKASTLEEAVEQCMFRVRDIIDPKAPAAGSVFVYTHTHTHTHTHGTSSTPKRCWVRFRFVPATPPHVVAPMSPRFSTPHPLPPPSPLGFRGLNSFK